MPMPLCTNCGQPVKGAVCLHCQTPVPGKMQASEAGSDEAELYQGFLKSEEIAIFNQYLRLLQGGLLEVVAMDSLGTDNNLELDDIKSIVKRGLKALQSAQERVRKEAEQEARRLAKESKKAARKEQREKKKASLSGRTKDKNIHWSRLLRSWPRWFILAALVGVVIWSLLRFTPLPEPAPPASPPPSASPPTAPRENIYLRSSQVACRSPKDLEEITRLAQNRESYVRMLNSGSCFVSRGDIELADLKAIRGSILEGRSLAGELLYFHDFSLRRERGQP
jgi:hypothetical protein